MDEIEVIPALSRALSHEKHHSEWTCSFQNGNWKMLRVLSRLKGKFPLLRRVWPVNITPHFSRTMNSRERRLNGVHTANTHTHNPQFLQSLWRRANARSVSFETIDGGQFTLSTQLIRLKDHIKAKLTILDVPLFDSAHSDNIPVGRVHLQQDNTFCWDVISHIVHLVKVRNKKFI